LLSKASARRTAQLAEAAAILDVIPGPGESAHCLMTGRYHLAQSICALIEKVGGCEHVRISTLALNAENARDLLAALDTGAIDQLSIIASKFFVCHNRAFWDETVGKFHERGQRIAAARCHAKVVTFACRDGRRFVMETSANCRSNSSIEQLCITQDAAVHDYFAGFFDSLIAEHEGDTDD
jgi:hypothetical protein